MYICRYRVSLRQNMMTALSAKYSKTNDTNKQTKNIVLGQQHNKLHTKAEGLSPISVYVHVGLHGF